MVRRCRETKSHAAVPRSAATRDPVLEEGRLVVKRTAKFYGPIVELSRLQGELNRLFAAFVETNKGGAPASS
jgi:hypothetical protein